MPKVLRIINRLNLGGPTYNVANLTKYLSPDFETLLLSGMKDEDEESSEFIMEQLGLSPRYIPAMYRELNPLKDYQSYKLITQIIKEYKPDIVHTHAAKAGAVGRLAAINANVPVVVHTFHGHVFHSYFSPIKTQLFLNIERYLAKKSTAIIALSELQKKELTDEFQIAPANKFHVINLGFDLSKFTTDKEQKRQKFRSDNNIDDNEIAIGIIGRLVPVKNHHFFIEVISRLKKNTTKKIRVFIFGDGELKEELYQHCDKNNIDFDKTTENNGKTIKFYSWIKEADIAIAAMDILCLTSKNEGTPVTLIEAQAGGCPFVTTDVGGIRDIVADNMSGIVVPKDDLDAFYDALKTLVEDDVTRKKMHNYGTDFALKKFGHLRLASDMENLYKKLLAEKGIS